VVEVLDLLYSFLRTYFDEFSFYYLGFTNRAGADFFYMKGTPFYHVFLLSGLQSKIPDYAIEANINFFILLVNLVIIAFTQIQR
jgi:hypothetical protein